MTAGSLLPLVAEKVAPTLALAPLAGLLADRGGRRQSLVWASGARMLSGAVIILAVAAAAAWARASTRRQR